MRQPGTSRLTMTSESNSVRELQWKVWLQFITKWDMWNITSITTNSRWLFEVAPIQVRKHILSLNSSLLEATDINPGFHEAIGDVIALSVSSPKHLQSVNLLKNYVPDQESEMNQIIRLGLEKLVFLPFAFVMDKFRWEVFRGNVRPKDANCYFWKLREKYGGVEVSTAYLLTLRTELLIESFTYSRLLLELIVTLTSLQNIMPALTLSICVTSCQLLFSSSSIRRLAPKPVNTNPTIHRKL